MAYNRIYELKITPFKIVGDELVQSGESIVIKNPITIRFNVNKMMYAGANCSANIEIYNLEKSTRDRIFYDWLHFEEIRRVELSAGYSNGKYDSIYKGTIRSCRPKKTNTDVIMEIEAQSGLFTLDDEFTVTIAAGETDTNVVHKIISNAKGITAGEQHLKNVSFPRTVSLMGDAFLLLKTYTNDKMFVDDERVLVLEPNDAIEGSVPVIDDETGLLGVPERDRTTVKVNCMFEPRIKVGQIVQIHSRIADVFDGQYKVWGISHSGVIGDPSGGQLTTSLTLFTGEQVFGYFKTDWNKIGS